MSKLFGSGRPAPFSLAMALLGSLVVLLVVAPLLGLVLSASLTEITGAASDAEVIDSILLTLAAGALATLACAIFGIPLAWLLARKRFPGRALLLALIDLPIVIPHSVAGIALLTVVGRHSFLAGTFGDFVGSVQGIALAMAFVSVPFLIHGARAGFEAVPVRLEQVARTLGATPAKAFATITLPLAWREVLSGMVMMWARGISEFGAVLIIAYHPMTTPVLVWERFGDYGLAYARAAAVVLLLVTLSVFLLLRFLGRRRRRHEARHA